MHRTGTTMIALGVLIVLPSAASTARAEHLRHAEERANHAHARAVEYVRYLQRHVPPSGASAMLLEDAAAIFRSVCELQQSLLFATGQPGEREEIGRYARGLYRYVQEARQRLKQLEAELDHGGSHLSHGSIHGNVYGGPTFQPPFAGSIPPRVEIHPGHDVKGLLRHQRRDRDRLRSRIGTLGHRLKEVERAIEHVHDRL